MEFCQENTLVIANTLFQQDKRSLYTWTSPDGQYRNQTDYIICSQEWRCSIQWAKHTWELTVSQIMNWSYCQIDLKKVGETTRPFRYDLSQIPYDYTVEVRKRFKGLDQKDRLPDELWMEVSGNVQETGIKTIPKKKKYQKGKWPFEEALQIAVEKGKWKTKERRKDIPIWMQSSKE